MALLDADGRLELVIARGEAAEQPLSCYAVPDFGHARLRVLPRTRHGAPARGALATLRAGGRRQLHVIDAGSGSLGPMEPVAHCGLGALEEVECVEVRWPGGEVACIEAPKLRRTIEVPHPRG